MHHGDETGSKGAPKISTATKKKSEPSGQGQRARERKQRQGGVGRERRVGWHGLVWVGVRAEKRTMVTRTP